jgi:hypothetical protein
VEILFVGKILLGCGRLWHFPRKMQEKQLAARDFR